MRVFRLFVYFYSRALYTLNVKFRALLINWAREIVCEFLLFVYLFHALCLRFPCALYTFFPARSLYIEHKKIYKISYYLYTFFMRFAYVFVYIECEKLYFFFARLVFSFHAFCIHWAREIDLFINYVTSNGYLVLKYCYGYWFSEELIRSLYYL